MPGKRDIGNVADKLVTTLRTALPAKLDTLDTEYNDGIVLEDIPTDNFFISERQKLPGFPLLCVIPESTDLNPFSGEFRYSIEYHNLTLAIALTANEDEDTLKKRALRTIRGVEEVLLSDRTLGGSVDDVLLIAKGYAPMLSNGNALLQEAQLTVRVQTRP